MTELKLYYPDGTKFGSEDEFVNFYEQVYFYENGNTKLEKMMDDIRNKSALELDDYGNILTWKTGGKYDKDKKLFLINTAKSSLNSLKISRARKRSNLRMAQSSCFINLQNARKSGLFTALPLCIS